MVNSQDMPGTSGFSEEFSLLLSGLVADAGLSKQDIASELGRSRAFVSDQLLGKRPVDTDVIAAIAELVGHPPRFIVRQVLDQMPPDRFGIPGINPEVDREATNALAAYKELLQRRRDAQAVTPLKRPVRDKAYPQVLDEAARPDKPKGK